MSEAPNRDTFEIVKSVTGWIAGAALMIIVGVTGSAYSDLKATQDKQSGYILELQRSSVTEEKLKDQEARLTANFQRELGFVRSELQTTNRLLEKVMEKMDKK